MSASHGFSQVTVYHKKWNVSMRKMALVNLLILLCLLMVPRCAMGETVWFSCDFGSIKNETFCSMVQVLSNGLDWKLASTSDKADTGPNKDHTNNAAGIGRFLWADSDDGAPGEKASISTPPFNLTNGEGWLTFWYHLYGVKLRLDKFVKIERLETFEVIIINYKALKYSPDIAPEELCEGL